MSISRRSLLGAAAAGGWIRAAGPPRPNILFVMTDDHPLSALSCYGNRILRTPNMDRIGAEGARFENAFVTNSLCAPARATLLTGCYSHVNGVRGNSESLQAVENLNPDLPAFPQLLQNAGYRTAIIGKWHLSKDPVGFDRWCVLPGQGRYLDPEFIDQGVRRQFKGHVTDIVTDLALDFLERRDVSKPFCLVYNPKGPHRPFTPDAAHAHRFDDIELPEPPAFQDDYRTRRIAAQAEDMRFDLSLASDYPDLPKNLSPAARKKWIFQRFVKDHYRTTAGIDQSLGRVLSFLDRNRLADDTLVVYTTDNGFFLGEHGWYDKRFMYEPSLRLPLLIRYPRAIRAGQTIPQMAANIDYAPTLLDFAGVTPPAVMQGRSLRPLLTGKSPDHWRQSIYYTYYENSWAMRDAIKNNPADPAFQFLTPHRVPPHRGVRTARHKYIEYSGENGYAELFDLEKDPHELRNRNEEKSHSAVKASLQRELQSLRQQYRDNG